MNTLFKHYENILLLLALVILASVLLANNIKEKEAPNPLEKFALIVASPLQKAVTSSIRETASLWNRYIHLVETSRKNVELKKKLEEERFKNNLLLEELKKYRRVENLLSFHPIAKTGFQVADVIAWDSTNLSQTFVINKGTQNKLQENMVVLTHNGLIGRIVNATKNSSRVLMITDSRSAVDAYVQETRVRCIIVGQNKKKCLIRYLPVDAKVKTGDVLISSGLGGIFPKGLLLGTISSIEPGNGRLFFKAEMVPAANLKRIEEVLIMANFPPSPQNILLENKE